MEGESGGSRWGLVRSYVSEMGEAAAAQQRRRRLREREQRERRQRQRRRSVGGGESLAARAAQRVDTADELPVNSILPLPRTSGPLTTKDVRGRWEGGDERKTFGYDLQREAREQLKKTCLPILNLPPERRLAVHITSLLDLVKADEFFHDLPADVCEELCHVMRYKHYIAGRTVFQQGDRGTTFYIILSGAVAVVVTHMGVKFARRLFAGHCGAFVTAHGSHCR